LNELLTILAILLIMASSLKCVWFDFIRFTLQNLIYRHHTNVKRTNNGINSGVILRIYYTKVKGIEWTIRSFLKVVNS